MGKQKLINAMFNYLLENFGEAWHIHVMTSDNEEQEQMAKKRRMIPVSDTDSTEDEGMVDFFLRICCILLFTLILKKHLATALR